MDDIWWVSWTRGSTSANVACSCNGTADNRETREKIHTKVNEKPVTQKEAALSVGVSESTFRKYRKMGLESEPSPTRNLLFDIDKVRAWQAENDPRKAR